MDLGRHGQMAYLLRLWQERNGERIIWRVSLRDVHGGEHGGKPLGFANLDRAVAYLRQQMEKAAESRRSGRDPDLVP
jgi:hypothetical protein